VFKVRLLDGVTQTPVKSGRPVSVNYATKNGTAVAPSDYTAASGTLVFAPGDTEKLVSVTVNGDTAAETNEVFTVVLSAPVNALLGASEGGGTIVNDDGSLPFLNVNDASLTEGNSGSKAMTFTVTLSAASVQG
jgi:hypothetical protein